MRLLLLMSALLLPLAANALARGDAAPDIWGKRMDNGAELRLSQLRGKVVYIDFWATWCAPCRVSMPLIQRMRDDLAGKGFEVLGVNVDKEADTARKLMQELGVNYPVLRDVGESTYEWYDIRGMPAAYVVDRKGKVRAIHYGFQKGEFPHMRSEIEKLLQEDNK
jgi:thiol-disulfide isomerase/thioredoxin